MHLRSSVLALSLSALASLAAAPMCAQVDLSAWPQVRLEVIAVDSSGVPVPALTAASLVLRDRRGKQVPVLGLAPANEPQSVCILLDASDADQLSIMKAKARRLLTHLAPADEVCVATFSSELRIAQDLTPDRRAAIAALDSIQPAGGTQLRDALLKTAEYMRTTSRSFSRAIILFSNGTDRHSAANRQQLQVAFEQPGSPVIHMICLPQQFGNARRKQGDPAEGTAFRLTGFGGGLTYFPHNMADLNALVEGLPQAMQSRYLLTYTPANSARDSHEERLQLSLAAGVPAGPGKVSIEAPEAYDAPAH